MTPENERVKKQYEEAERAWIKKRIAEEDVMICAAIASALILYGSAGVLIPDGR